MRKKCFRMAIVSLVIALAVFAFTYFFYHYFGHDGSFGLVFHKEPVKPYVSFCLGMWGVLHFFAAVTSFLSGLIFFPKDSRK